MCFEDDGIKNNFLKEVACVYEDVLQAGAGSEGGFQLTLQLEGEDWSGEFIDVTPECVLDKSVLRAILPQPITYLKQKVSFD